MQSNAAVVDPLSKPAMGGQLDDEIASRNASSMPAETGQYPNLNVAPGAAAPQLTAEESAAKKAALKAEQQAVASTPTPRQNGNPSNLKKLARSHAQDVLKEIEGGSEAD